MDYSREYNQKRITPEQAASFVRSGDWVDYGGVTAFPSLFDKALSERKDELENVRVRSFLLNGPIRIAEEDPHQEHFTYHSWLMTHYERQLGDRGLCHFIPMLFRHLPLFYRQELDVNIVVIGVTPMDKFGYFNFSINSTALRAMADAADLIILEVNESLPRVSGLEQLIHISEVDWVIEGPHGELDELPAVPISRTDHAIAEHILPYITNGASLQLGVGKLPNAVGKLLVDSDLRDLGIHTEMLVDAFYELHKAGKISNRRKSGLFRGRTVFGFAVGSRELYRWCEEDPSMMAVPMNVVNDPKQVADVGNFISINSCLAMDLYGQIAAETIGTRQISGTGGQLDFVTGAFENPLGRSFVCMSSTYIDHNGNRQSRIRPSMEGDIITDPRSQVQFVVTEFGVANLSGVSSYERAERMINLAHPDFRDVLIRNAESLQIWRRSNRR